jgi:hypothetical protein
MLMEVLVYLGVVAVILGLSMTLLHRGFANHKNLRRNAEDIARTLDAGERWRADVRAAMDLPWLEIVDGAEMLRIQQPDGEVDYLFDNGTIWRAQQPQEQWVPVLQGVKSAQTLGEEARGVSWLRWEIELATEQKAVRMVPRFTFQAVPGGIRP